MIAGQVGEGAGCNGAGGEGGIRTPGTLASTSDFESGAFNRALPPLRLWLERHGHSDWMIQEWRAEQPGAGNASWLTQCRTLYEDTVLRLGGRGGQESGGVSQCL